MILDDLSTGDASDWRVTGGDGADLTNRLSVVPEGADGGPCLALEARLEEGRTLRLTKRLRMPLPEQVRFRYRRGGEAAAAPDDRFRILVEIRTAPSAVRDFLPEISDARDPGNWITARADMKRPRNLVNVWSFYGHRNMSELSLVVEGIARDFIVFIDRVEVMTADERMGPYRPAAPNPAGRSSGQTESSPPRIVYAGNNAGDLYDTERFLAAAMPDARISVHPFRSLSYPPDQWPVSLAGTNLVVLTDFDTYVLSDARLIHLADYVHGGGRLLVLAGPNSVSRSLDRRALFEQMLPVEAIDRSLIHCTSGPVLVSDSLLVGDVLPDHLGYIGTMQRLRAKKGATVILAAEHGTAVLVEGRFGTGRIVVLNACPDAEHDRGRSLFWSCCYLRLMGGLAARMAGEEPAAIPEEGGRRAVPVSGCVARIRLPWRKRAFAPGQEVRIEATCTAAHPLHLWIVDESGRCVDRVAGPGGKRKKWRCTWTVPDLAEGRYRMMLGAGGAEEEIAVVCRRADVLRLPVIARIPLKEGGLWHNVEGLRRMIDDLAAHGFNRVAPPVLGVLASEPDGWTAELSGRLEMFAQERGMDVMYDYSGLGTVRTFQPPPVDPYGEDALGKTRRTLASRMEAADQVPRLRCVKTIDEPSANRKNIFPGESAERLFRERFGRALPTEEEVEGLEGQALLDYYRFLSDCVKRQFELGYQAVHERERSWGLLHTFMTPGFGYQPVSENFEDVLAWGGSGDYLDFDIYPYWYVESHRLRFAKVHYGFAFMRAAAAFHDRPLGFYVELDERNHPFQITPKEATRELAYTAIGEGCHYLNTFIYGTFSTGSMARPERWEDGGEALRAIGRAGPLIMASQRPPARAAVYFPYDHWILSGERYYPTFACELLRRSFGECDLVHQDAAREKGLTPYRIVALFGTDVLSGDDEERFCAFVRAGGVLLLDTVPSRTPSGKELTRLMKMAGRMPDGDIEEKRVGKGTIVKLPPNLDAAYRRAVEEDDLAGRRRIEWDMRDALSRTGVYPAVGCDDPECDASLLDAEGATILVVVNHRPDPATPFVRVHRAAHPIGYACHLSTGEAIPCWNAGEVGRPEAVCLTVPLAARQGILIGLFPEKPGTPSLSARREGTEMVIEVDGGTLAPVPLFIEAKDPRGRKNVRHSREEVLRGRVMIRSPLAINEPEGEWEILARCPAAGWEERVRLPLLRP